MHASLDFGSTISSRFHKGLRQNISFPFHRRYIWSEATNLLAGAIHEILTARHWTVKYDRFLALQPSRDT